MAEIIVLKNNVVMSKIFSVDADAVLLSDVAEVGDVYDPKTGEFSKPLPPAPPEPSADDLLAMELTAKRNEDIRVEAERQRNIVISTALARKAKIQAGIDELTAKADPSAADEALLETLRNGLEDVNAKL